MASRQAMAAMSWLPVLRPTLAWVSQHRPSIPCSPASNDICRRSAKMGSCVARDSWVQARRSSQCSLESICICSLGPPPLAPPLSPGTTHRASSTSCSMWRRTTWGYAREWDSIAAAGIGPMTSCRAVLSCMATAAASRLRMLLRISPRRISHSWAASSKPTCSRTTARHSSSVPHRPSLHAAATALAASFTRAAPPTWMASPSTCVKSASRCPILRRQSRWPPCVGLSSAPPRRCCRLSSPLGPATASLCRACSYSDSASPHAPHRSAARIMSELVGPPKRRRIRPDRPSGSSSSE
mmetsp:Transcript_8834/g.25458  ORF Transcript_8834/g.25458 Transcript_8834/m.25458 type:complete len:297 (-) Transcript_8834:3250-4140(-)